MHLSQERLARATPTPLAANASAKPPPQTNMGPALEIALNDTLLAKTNANLTHHHGVPALRHGHACP
eukprot:11221281-Lingulodinium_polyedra.AAC.1